MIFQKKFQLSSCFLTAAGLFSAGTLVYYLIQSNHDACFQVSILVLLAVGMVGEIASLFVKVDFIPMLASSCIGVALGLMVYYALPTFSDLWNNVNFIGGNAFAYFMYLGLLLLSFVLSVIPCFLSEKEEK